MERRGCAAWYGINAVTLSGAEIEGGWALTNATVRAGFQHRTYSWKEGSRSEPKFGKTDDDGTVDFRGDTNCGEVCCTVWGLDGYYKPRPVTLYGDKGKCEGVAASMIRFFVPERWTVTNDVRFVMRKVGRPVPLKAKRVRRWSADGLYPDGTDTLAYDLMAGDWLPPLGKGTFADVELVHRRIDRGEGVLYDGSEARRIWRDEVEMRFPGDGNGLVGYASGTRRTTGSRASACTTVCRRDSYIRSAQIREGRGVAKARGFFDILCGHDKDFPEARAGAFRGAAASVGLLGGD